ncbi:MAG: permease [Firmicutes bacterium]|nr:permease [Bacillota bacterium]
MGRYKNFKLAIYCTAQNMVDISAEALAKQLDFFRHYCGCDKVYLEPYRDGLTVPQKQLEMIRNFFLDQGIEVSGALTTTVQNLTENDKEKQRLGGTYCYVNKNMREHLVKTVQYTASLFDEIIIDDWFFTNCTCQECRDAKGEQSWEEFRTNLLAEVSEKLVVKAAKAVNPNCKLIIKFPNWVESYQEAGYSPAVQRHIFDGIYTGTETRNTKATDQHLPRYLSYSLVRLLENYAPGKNLGSWFDPYGCIPIDIYLEQAYLSAFAKSKELTLFCWGSLYKNRVVTPLGLQLDFIDRFLTQTGNCLGVPCYLPPDAQGEDHVEDFLGMAGVPFEHTPAFPDLYASKTVFLTVQAHKDPEIISKLEKFVSGGGKAIVTSGFIIEGLNKGIEQLTSIRYRGRRFHTNQFQAGGVVFTEYWYSRHKMTFPLLEHRNNTTWTLAKAVVGEENYPIVLRDTYGKGQLITISVPDEYGYIYDLPPQILTIIRSQFTDTVPFYLEGPGQASLFVYDNDVFALYLYVGELTKGNYRLVAKGNADALRSLNNPNLVMRPVQKGPVISYDLAGGAGYQTVFDLPMLQPGDLNFFKIEWNEKKEGVKIEEQVASAPHDFLYASEA